MFRMWSHDQSSGWKERDNLEKKIILAMQKQSLYLKCREYTQRWPKGTISQKELSIYYILYLILGAMGYLIKVLNTNSSEIKI